MNYYAILIVASILCVFFAFFFLRKRPKAIITKHKRNVETSHRRLEKLAFIGKESGVGGQLSYLRKVDAYVFEEMILTAVESKFHEVVRNKKYSGDGGVDGLIIVNGESILVQAKRYSSYVSTKHLFEFKILCESKNMRGIFVHTGKTPKKAWDVADKTVEIISGHKLIKLLTSAASQKNK